METELLTLFGVSVEQLAFVSGVVLFVIQWLKGEFPEQVKGWTTRLIALTVAFALSAEMLLPDYKAVIALALLSFMVPGGAKGFAKKLVTIGGKKK